MKIEEIIAVRDKLEATGRDTSVIDQKLHDVMCDQLDGINRKSKQTEQARDTAQTLLSTICVICLALFLVAAIMTLVTGSEITKGLAIALLAVGVFTAIACRESSIAAQLAPLVAKLLGKG